MAFPIGAMGKKVVSMGSLGLAKDCNLAKNRSCPYSSLMVPGITSKSKGYGGVMATTQSRFSIAKGNKYISENNSVGKWFEKNEK